MWKLDASIIADLGVSTQYEPAAYSWLCYAHSCCLPLHMWDYQQSQPACFFISGKRSHVSIYTFYFLPVGFPCPVSIIEPQITVQTYYIFIYFFIIGRKKLKLWIQKLYLKKKDCRFLILNLLFWICILWQKKRIQVSRY